MTSDIANWKDRKVFFLGVNTGYVKDGLPDGRYIEFYRRRSSIDLYCSIIGNVVIPGGYGSNDATPTLSRDRVWTRVAEAITEGGSLPGIQLATSWEGYRATRKFVGRSPSAVIADARTLVDKLGPVGCGSVIDAFMEAALMAVDHGYRHVQLHGAHGYLLSLLIDKRINARSEDAHDRLARLAHRLASDGIETSLRISLLTGDPAFDANGTDDFYDLASKLPFDFFDLSSGFYNIDKRLIYPSRPQTIIERHALTARVANKYPSQKFILSGRALQARRESFPGNVHLGLCRDLIANPAFLSQPEQGCENRNKCHYFSRGEASLTCARWTPNESFSPSSVDDP